MYTYPPLFLRIRIAVLSCIAFISFLWTVLLSFYIFYQWEILKKAEQSIIVLLLLSNAITIIILFILLILPLRTWLDAARCMFLLVCHVGVAAAIAHWKPQFQCNTTDHDQAELCRFTATYMCITSWTVPVLIVLYLQGLAFVVYRVRRTDADCGCVGDVVEVEGSPASILGEGLRNAMAEHTAPPSPSVSLASKTRANARLSKLPRTSYC